MILTYWRFQSHDRLLTRALVVAATVMVYAVTSEPAPCQLTQSTSFGLCSTLWVHTV
jgi:hypothetical protein